MQFAQEFADVIRDYNSGQATQGEKKLDGKLAAAVSTRFFVDSADEENWLYAGGLVATELHTEYGEFFTQEIIDEDDLDEKAAQKMQVRLGAIKPEHHGHNFEGMWNDDDLVEMNKFIITAVLFDENDHFAGFSFIDPVTNEHVVDTPLKPSQLRAEGNSEKVVRSQVDLTRLIGFRTTKRCESDKFIESLQPIYYSLDREMCTEVLISLSSSHLDEIGGYGPTCEQRTAEFAMQMDAEEEFRNFDHPVINEALEDGTEQQAASSEHDMSYAFKFATGCLLWLSTLMICYLVFSECSRKY